MPPDNLSTPGKTRRVGNDDRAISQAARVPVRRNSESDVPDSEPERLSSSLPPSLVFPSPARPPTQSRTAPARQPIDISSDSEPEPALGFGIVGRPRPHKPRASTATPKKTTSAASSTSGTTRNRIPAGCTLVDTRLVRTASGTEIVLGSEGEDEECYADSDAAAGTPRPAARTHTRRAGEMADVVVVVDSDEEVARVRAGPGVALRHVDPADIIPETDDDDDDDIQEITKRQFDAGVLLSSRAAGKEPGRVAEFVSWSSVQVNVSSGLEEEDVVDVDDGGYWTPTEDDNDLADDADAEEDDEGQDSDEGEVCEPEDLATKYQKYWSPDTSPAHARITAAAAARAAAESSSPQRRSPRKLSHQAQLKKSAEAAAQQALEALQLYAEQVYTWMNHEVFAGRLPALADLRIVWAPRLMSTSGRARYYRDARGAETVSIELATKIIDCEDRVRRTLSHEMCHLATWIIDDDFEESHGANFRKWADRVEARDPAVIIVETHSYVIRRPFTYVCSAGCGTRKSLYHPMKDDHTCKRCGAAFKLHSAPEWYSPQSREAALKKARSKPKSDKQRVAVVDSSPAAAAAAAAPVQKWMPPPSDLADLAKQFSVISLESANCVKAVKRRS
ncbi:unnamed protein product [Mycena citricolor]|uniref:SprT-like domain-containing protein n=1 Tax=Mycena citricolor TaxID=2018698 RepID=A0AAD2Q6M8_9AGAR|nr:unnamed protein product [Mycena citricolor]